MPYSDMNKQDAYKKHLEDVHKAMVSKKLISPERKYHYLYQITNNINGKMYLGRHSTDEFPDTDNYMGSGTKLWKAYEKHGIKNFTKHIIHYCNSFPELCALEATLVNYEFIKSREVYNIAAGGYNGRWQLNVSQETRDKISKSLTGKVRGPCADSTKLKMRLTQLGRKTKPHTTETKRKISEGNKGKVPTPQALENQRKGWLAKVHRPWLNNAVKNNETKLKPYMYLDLVYDLYVTYDFTKYGTKESFTSKVKSLYGYCPRQGMWNYFNEHGDPRQDSLWSSFKQEVSL